MRLDLPSAARNPISLIGVVFFVFLALQMGGQLQNPYLGLLL